MKKQIIRRMFSKEPVLCCAAVLAACSMLLVRPSAAYAAYIDLRTLVLLFCLMTVVAGLNGQGVFAALAQRLLRRFHTHRRLTLFFVALCFFSSMFITNDVALLTFVPFSFMVLRMCDRADSWIVVTVLETVAANLGSMLTPIGNPQNLYLYSVYRLNLGQFFGAVLPYLGLSLLLLIASCLFFTRHDYAIILPYRGAAAPLRRGFKLTGYLLLFLLCISAVLRLTPYPIVFGIVVVFVLLFDFRTLKKVDYSLLATFLSLFILVGNISSLPAVAHWLSSVVGGHEIVTAVALSQVISNVPAAILLSGFTDRFAPLLIGVNIGGLGTLIASMASLISYRIYVRETGGGHKAYLICFTLINVAFLAILLCFALLI